MRRIPTLCALCFLFSSLVVLTNVAVAQESPPSEPDVPAQPQPAPTPPRCDSAEHRQFDFWVGDWQVTNPDGSLAGENRIELILDDCVLRESWASASGAMRGHSYNIYSRAKRGWHQTWVDSTGTLLELDGGLVDGAMVLEGTATGRDGGEVLHRITWTPNENGTVRQHWQFSNDGGKTWADAFDGTYTRKGTG